MEAIAAQGGPVQVSSAAFAAFYDTAAAEVYRYLAKALFGDRVAAEDLTQETFAAVVVAARAGKSEALTLPWVMGVARHKLVDHYRRSAREARRDAVLLRRRTMDEELTELQDVDSAVVFDALSNLSHDHQLILVLRYVDDLPVDEIAALLSRSHHATNSLLVRARRALLANVVEERR